MSRAFRILFVNELVSMLRQPANLFFIFIFPLFFLGIMLFSFGSDGTLGPVTVEVVDDDRSGLSADYVDRVNALFTTSGIISGEVRTGNPAVPLESGRIRITLPAGFEESVLAGRTSRIRLEYNAANGMLTQIATRVLDPLTLRFNTDTMQNATPAKLELKNVTGLAQISFPQYLVTGILVMSMLSTAVVSTALVVAYRREQNTFKLLSCLPLQPSHILVAIMAARGIVILFSGLVLLLVAVKVFGMPVEIDPARLANATGVIAFGGLSLLALGLMLSSRIATVQGAIFAGNVTFIALLFLSDLAIPLRSVSTGVLSWLQYLPSAAFVNALRSVMVHGQTAIQQWQHIVVMLAWTAVFLVITRYTFRWHRV
jgi:ABC-2 type transport system permease protein